MKISSLQSSGGVVKLEVMNTKGAEVPWEEGEMGMSDVRKDVPPKTAFTVSAGFECLEIYYKKNVDLYLCYCGIEECSKGHSFGPAVRNEYLIHYILSGRGIYQIPGKTYEVGPGEFFLIPPGQTTFYQADKEEPWSYIWIGFQGMKAPMYMEYLHLDGKERVVGKCSQTEKLKHLVEQMLRARALTFADELQREGLLYEFIAELARDAERDRADVESAQEEYPKQIYVDHMLHYIERHLDQKILISEMAKEIGLSRNYLSNCFKSVMHETLKDYLTRIRMEKAERLLTTTTDTIGEVAAAVGYKDALAFSKVFHKKYQISPTAYREQYAKNPEELQIKNNFF